MNGVVVSVVFFKVTRIIGKRIAVLIHESTNVVEKHHIKNSSEKTTIFRTRYFLDVDDDSRMEGLVVDEFEDLAQNNTVPNDGS